MTLGRWYGGIGWLAIILLQTACTPSVFNSGDKVILAYGEGTPRLVRSSECLQKIKSIRYTGREDLDRALGLVIANECMLSLKNGTTGTILRTLDSDLLEIKITTGPFEGQTLIVHRSQIKAVQLPI